MLIRIWKQEVGHEKRVSEDHLCFDIALAIVFVDGWTLEGGQVWAIKEQTELEIREYVARNRILGWHQERQVLE